jgi:hypothetical protein
MAFTSQDTVISIDGVTPAKVIKLEADKATLEGARGEVLIGYQSFAQLPTTMKHDKVEDAMNKPVGPIQFTLQGLSPEAVTALREPKKAFKIKALNVWFEGKNGMSQADLEGQFLIVGDVVDYTSIDLNSIEKNKEISNVSFAAINSEATVTTIGDRKGGKTSVRAGY